MRGIAQCDPRDSFNETKGQELAAARCNAKVAAKRVKRAQKKAAEAEKILKDAQRHYNKMNAYYMDSHAAVIEAENQIDEVLKEM